MNPTILRVLLGCLAGGAVAHAQVILQNFSTTVGPNSFFYGTWEASGDNGGSNNPNANFVQGSGVYDITGTTGLIPTNGAASKLELFNASPVSIATNTSLAVSAQMLATNVASSFTVTLVDTSAKTAFATFDTADFVTGSYTTITKPLSFQLGFDAGSIDSMIISGGQPGGTDRFNVSFDNVSAVSAVPEPSEWAAFAGAATLGLAVWQRRRTRRARSASQGVT
jgi:hypothetical protein